MTTPTDRVDSVVADNDNEAAASVPTNEKGGCGPPHGNGGCCRLRAADVVMGRGSGPNQRGGNVRFRALVWETFTGARSGAPGSNTRTGMDKLTKKELAQRVLSKVKEGNGRFLQRITQAPKTHPGENRDENDEKRGAVYVEVPDKKVIEKIKQTYRFLRSQKSGSDAGIVKSRFALAKKKEHDGTPQLAPSVPSVITCEEPSASSFFARHLAATPTMMSLERGVNASVQMDGNYGTGAPPLPFSEMMRRPSLFEMNMAALRAEEAAVNLISARLLRLQEEEERHRRRRQIMVAAEMVIRADAERSILLSNRLRALEHVRDGSGHLDLPAPTFRP
jgi:hypothetical protein